MRKLLTIILTLLLSGATISQARDIVIVVNLENKLENLTRREVVDIYMGRTATFSNGNAAIPLDQAPTSSLRVEFYDQLIGKRVAQVNAYWAKLLFTGRATPPKVVDDETAVLQIVRENRDAIGYMDSTNVDDTVKIVNHVK